MEDKIEKECKYYNDHDSNVAECDEILDDRFLPVNTCAGRIDCLRKCKYFDDDNRGEICLADRVDMYGEKWDYPLCKDNSNCHYKQLLQSQHDLKVAKEAMEKTLEYLVITKNCQKCMALCDSELRKSCQEPIITIKQALEQLKDGK